MTVGTDAYLDHAGIGLVRPAARAAMHAAIDTVLARGSPAYADFFAARTAARAAAARLLTCDADEVALVANTGAALSIVAAGLDWHDGDEIVVFDQDFPANVHPWRHLTRRGVELRWVPQRRGGYDLADLRRAAGARTRLIAVSQVNFLTGFQLDLDEVCAIAHEHGALVCVDAVQGVGAIPLDLSRVPVDFLAAGGHKWVGGPPGTGLFYCRRDRLELLRDAPLGWFGFDRSDAMFASPAGALTYDLEPRPAARRFEGGMLNFPGIVGLDAALREILDTGVDRIWDRIRILADRLRTAVHDRGFVVAGAPWPAATSGIVTVSHPNSDLRAWHDRLTTLGCHCSYINGHVRFSPHYWTTDQDVDDAIAMITDLHRFLDADSH